jgi:hypothetical protein
MRWSNSRSLTVRDLVGDDVDTAVAGDTNLRGQVAEINTDDALWVSDGSGEGSAAGSV